MKIIEKLKENYPAEVVLLTIVSFLAGVVVGLILSPLKNGIAIGSYNGSYNKFEDSNNVEDSNKVTKSVNKPDKKSCK